MFIFIGQDLFSFTGFCITHVIQFGQMSTILVFLSLWRRRIWSRSIYSLSSQLCNNTRPCSSSTTTAQAKSKQKHSQLIQVNSTAHHCMQIVKKYDYENYLASLLIAPDDLRRAAFALRAFNVELAQVRDLTHTDAIAQMRFQFWADLVDEIYAEKADYDGKSAPKPKYSRFPVASELHEVLASSEHLSKHWLKRMITARREAAHLSAFPFQTMEQLEKYAESTIVSLYYLLNEKIVELSKDVISPSSPGHRIALDHIASHLGKAQGLTNVLRGVRHNAAQRRCYIPNEVLANSHCTHEDFLRGNNNEAVVEAVFAIASLANSHLEHADELLDGLSSSANRAARRADKLVYLPNLAVREYLEQLRRCDFNLWHRRLQQKNGLLPLKLWWRAKFV